MSNNGFIKLNRSEITEELLEHHPNAFLLLTLISIRAKRESTLKLKVGESYIGDFAKCGLTRQKYRTAVETLVELNVITIKATNSGTTAMLCNSMIYDCNLSGGNQQVNPEITTEQPQDNQPVTTEQPLTRSKEVEEVKKEELINNTDCDSFLGHWNSIEGIQKRSFRTEKTKATAYKEIKDRLKSFKHEDVEKFFIAVAESTFLFKYNWFSLDFCIRSDKNFEKVIDKWMDWEKQKKQDELPFYHHLLKEGT